MRLIDADTLKKSIKSYADDQYAENEYLGECAIMDIIDNAKTIPILDFKEGYKQAIIDGKTNFSRPQGEWMFLKANEEQTDGYECSVCKATYHTRVPYFSEFNFCPNCGADMRGNKNG